MLRRSPTIRSAIIEISKTDSIITIIKDGIEIAHEADTQNK